MRDAGFDVLEGTEKHVMQLEGLMCGACVKTVSSVIAKHEGVRGSDRAAEAPFVSMQ